MSSVAGAGRTPTCSHVTVLQSRISALSFELKARISPSGLNAADWMPPTYDSPSAGTDQATGRLGGSLNTWIPTRVRTANNLPCDVKNTPQASTSETTNSGRPVFVSH